jgi:surfeit locus 1 family protein
MRLRFRFRTVPFLATLILVLLGIALGNWQTRRAAEKSALQARLEQGMAAAPLMLDGGANRSRAPGVPPRDCDGRIRPQLAGVPRQPAAGRPHAGFILLMPFKIAGADKYVLVARGWLPRNTAEHDRLPPFTTPPAASRSRAGRCASWPA